MKLCEHTGTEMGTATFICCTQCHKTLDTIKAHELLEDIRDAITTCVSAGGGSFSRHILPLYKDIIDIVGPRGHHGS